jgi:hypothetical protein
MRIDSSGNVGIGTASPGQKLTVIGTTRFQASGQNLIIQSTAAAGNNYIDFYDNTGTRQTYIGCAGSTNRFEIYQATANPITLSTNATERMRIDSSGNIVIGNTATINSERLAVWTVSGIGIKQAMVINNAHGYGSGVGTAASALTFTRSRNNSEFFPMSQIVSGNESETTSAFGYMAFYTTNTTQQERMRIHSSGGVSIGNTTDSGAASLNVSGSMSGGYIAHANGTTAMAFGTNNVARVTPTATASYTTTVPAAGAICVLSILTSGATSYTITFSTGFKSTGTLATGTTTARYFNITFVSDGTNLIEMSRTVAIA